MNNPRITPKERNLIKGSIRRVFSRSDIRRLIVEASIVEGYSDISRKRVKTWCLCNSCKKPEAKSNVQVDHIIPVVALDSTLEEMSWDDVVNNQWCDIKNLQVLCTTCHDEKTKQERVERNRYRRIRNELKRNKAA